MNRVQTTGFSFEDYMSKIGRPKVTRVQCVCETCKKIFEVVPSRTTQGTPRFCSWYCRTTLPWTERFWSFVDKSGGLNACWPWTGFIDKDGGYGHFSVPTENGHIYTGAHRVAWELKNGPIPDGMFVCHNCPNGDLPSCCNDNHLWLGTHIENMADMCLKGRAATGDRNGKRKKVTKSSPV